MAVLREARLGLIRIQENQGFGRLCFRGSVEDGTLRRVKVGSINDDLHGKSG